MGHCSHSAQHQEQGSKRRKAKLKNAKDWKTTPNPSYEILCEEWSSTNWLQYLKRLEAWETRQETYWRAMSRLENSALHVLISLLETLF